MAQAPEDADKRRAVKPVICYPAEGLSTPDLELYRAARLGAVKVSEVLAPPREAACFHVPVGSFSGFPVWTVRKWAI